MNKSTTYSYLVILLVFITSRILFFKAGIRFDSTVLYYGWQFIDVHLLKTNLWQSVFYLHGQPPLFNIFLGVIIKSFSQNYLSIFYYIYLIIGLFTAFLLYTVLQKIKINPAISLAISILYIISPAVILNENLLFYDHVLPFLLLLSAFFLLRHLETSKLKFIFFFFSTLAVLLYIRSLFHLVWFVGIILLLCFYNKKNYKQILLIAAIPFILVLALYIKNFVFFGNFTTDSWLGMNLASTTWNEYSFSKRQQMVKDKKLDPIVIQDPFQSVDTYKSYIPLHKITGIEVLDEKTKTGGFINYHNINYVALGKIYLKNSINLIKSNPNIYTRTLMRAYVFYASPPSNNHVLFINLPKIKIYDGIFSLFFYGGGFYTFFGLPILLFYSSKKIIEAFKKKELNKEDVFLIYIFISVIYVAIIGNLFELGENNRSFFITQPFIIVLAGLVIRNSLHNKRKIH